MAIFGEKARTTRTAGIPRRVLWGEQNDLARDSTSKFSRACNQTLPWKPLKSISRDFCFLLDDQMMYPSSLLIEPIFFACRIKLFDTFLFSDFTLHSLPCLTTESLPMVSPKRGPPGPHRCSMLTPHRIVRRLHPRGNHITNHLAGEQWPLHHIGHRHFRYPLVI